MINRRRLLAAGGVLLATPLLLGHTPFRQWVVYRQTHLVVLASKDDMPSFALSKQVADALVAHLPESRARVALAPDDTRIASLLRTRQISLAVTTVHTARALTLGLDRFAGGGPIPLRTLFVLGDHILIGHAEFPREHGWLVVDALAVEGNKLAVDGANRATRVDGVPPHEGLADYLAGTGGPPPESE